MILMRYNMGIIVVGEFIVFVFIFKKKKSSFFILFSVIMFLVLLFPLYFNWSFLKSQFWWIFLFGLFCEALVISAC